MSQIIAFANQKGGVGKTTSTVNLGYALVQLGKRVLVVDMDPQASLTLYCGHDPRKLEENQETIYWGLQKDGMALDSFIIPGELPLLPSSIQLARAETQFAREWDSVSILRDKIQPLRANYDFILLDCPPTLALLAVNALTAANAVLIPVKTDYLSIMGIPLLLETIDEVKRRPNPLLRIIGVLPTMFNQRNSHDNEALEELRKSLEPHIHVFPPINRSTNFDKAAAESRATLEIMPRTPSVQNYTRLAENLANA